MEYASVYRVSPPRFLAECHKKQRSREACCYMDYTSGVGRILVWGRVDASKAPRGRCGIWEWGIALCGNFFDMTNLMHTSGTKFRLAT